jgi:hypothetical protein
MSVINYLKDVCLFILFCLGEVSCNYVSKNVFLTDN